MGVLLLNQFSAANTTPRSIKNTRATHSFTFYAINLFAKILMMIYLSFHATL